MALKPQDTLESSILIYNYRQLESLVINIYLGDIFRLLKDQI